MVTVMAAVMSPGGFKAGPESCMDQKEGRDKSGFFLNGVYHDTEKVSISFASLDVVISFLVET